LGGKGFQQDIYRCQVQGTDFSTTNNDLGKKNLSSLKHFFFASRKTVEVTVPEIEEMRLAHYVTMGSECTASLAKYLDNM